MGLKENMTQGMIEKEISDLLNQTYSPTLLDIVNESDMHSGPKGRESHFKVLVVSEFFKDMRSIDRQKHIYQTLKNVMTRIHALSLRALTPLEIEKVQGFESPNCAHKKS